MSQAEGHYRLYITLRACLLTVQPEVDEIKKCSELHEMLLLTIKFNTYFTYFNTYFKYHGSTYLHSLQVAHLLDLKGRFALS